MGNRGSQSHSHFSVHAYVYAGIVKVIAYMWDSRLTRKHSQIILLFDIWSRFLVLPFTLQSTSFASWRFASVFVCVIGSK